MLNKKGFILAVFPKNVAIVKNHFAKKSIVSASTRVFHAQTPVNASNVTTKSTLMM
jgi:hypothetical protein